MKNFLTFLLFQLFSLGLFGQITISDARNTALGQTVTISGIVTNGDELGPIRYIQDATGGLPAYSPGEFANTTKPGDEVTVTGVLKDFNGLLELDPVSAFQVISSGNPLPVPRTVTPAQMNENIESQLITIEGAVFANGGGTFASANYNFTANGESSTVFLRTNHPLIGTNIPIASVNLTGIVAQFRTDYQLLIRDENDIVVADDFFFTANPTQSDINTDGFKVSWSTNKASSTRIKYGLTPALGQEVDVAGQALEHTVTLSGLEDATFYYVQAESAENGQTRNSPVYLFSTASNSTGELRVYFTGSVDARYSNGSQPNGTTPAAVEAAIIDRINQAEETVDVFMYNNSRAPIVAALTQAHLRGVRVRYVTDTETQNEALSNPRPPFQVFGGNAEALMHNKIVLIDAASEDDSWVIMGSMNFTTFDVSENKNNMVFIQDEALAKAYTIEFEEMWGSDNSTPGFFAARFGASKKDNTPHLFMINGRIVESHFSPSDRTTAAIEKAIRSADNDLQFALLTMTRNELGTATLDMHRKGVGVRGIIENVGDTGTEYQFLLDNGVAVEHHDLPGLIHHKYGLVDAAAPDSDPIVITGSHNWTAAAETSNDENTLIFHHPALANIYLQEFEQRWCELTTPTNCLSSIFDRKEINLNFTVQPNPVNDVCAIKGEWQAKTLIYKLFDTNGQMVLAGIRPPAQQDWQISLEALSAGVYWLSIEADGRYGIQKVVKI